MKLISLLSAVDLLKNRNLEAEEKLSAYIALGKSCLFAKHRSGNPCISSSCKTLPSSSLAEKTNDNVGP